MHILLAAIGSAGDVHPTLGVGLALRERGHAATIVTNPIFEGAARRLGLGFIPLGAREDFEAIMRNPDLWHPTRAFGMIARRMIVPHLAPLYEIVARHDPADTVVFASQVCFGARVAQERLGARLVTHHLAPGLLWSRFQPPVFGNAALSGLPRALQVVLHRVTVAVVDRTLGPPVNAFRAGLGLPPARDLFYRWCNSPAGALGLFPTWFAPPQPDWPPRTRLTGFPLFDPPDPDIGDAGSALPGASPAPLVFTFGSANIHAHAFFAAAVAASRALGRPAILLTRDRAQLPDRLPPGVVHRPWAPLRTLLPGAAALIHHGGIGTTAQGLAAGLPHLVTPLSHDQPDNAARLRRLGVGATLAPRAFTGRRVAAALDRLLSSEAVRRRGAELAARCDPAAALATARVIEELAEDRPGRPV